MTKRERRAQQLAAHYERLEKLTGKDGKKMSLKLWKLETEAHKIITKECNGEATEHDSARLEKILTEVKELLPNVEGIFINGDPRGYALKVDDQVMRSKKYDLTQDWGGYGILSPEIN